MSAAEGLRLTVLHTRLLVLEKLRVPIEVAGTTVFPLLTLLFFVVPQPFAQETGAATEAAAQLAVFTVLSVCLFSFGVGLAEERASPWDSYLRTLPVGRGPRFGAHVLTAAVFTLLGLAPLLAAAHALTAATLPSGRWGLLPVAVLVAGLPLLGLGMAIGYTLASKAALAVAQCLLLPLAFGGGLFLPPQTFPAWLKGVSGWLPTRAGRDLVVGTATGQTPGLATVAVLAGWTVLLWVLAAYLYGRDARRRFR